ncbi:MAG: UDP-glucose 4-epimerase GalE [Firmicutes bacterium]|nr:UDP-glucose 4-epimerase GalE [Bacillota bacterium]
MAILVTGGAGYIGSHTVKYLKSLKKDVVVLDNLSKGHREAVLDVPLYVGDIQDAALIKRICREHDIAGAIHFAAYSLVGESVKQPLKYYENNVCGTMSLVKSLVKNEVFKIVFSSTAAVYGEPGKVPIIETDKTVPTNPYGDSKLAIEKMLKWAYEAYGLRSASLRYFNAAGADPEGLIGEDHKPETHLIPLVLNVALKKRENITVFGDDYPTKDGTCIRDYIHVMDLASAHFLALQKLETSAGAFAYNLGNGEGFSVKEVIDVASEVTSLPIPMNIGQRRRGDPATLVASQKKAEDELNWQRKYKSLEKIISDAWRWHKNHPSGFE